MFTASCRQRPRTPDGRWVDRSRTSFPSIFSRLLCRRPVLERCCNSLRRWQHVHGKLVDSTTLPEFAQYLEPLANIPWVRLAKRRFAGPSQILEYLGRYTHRVAIANGRLLRLPRIAASAFSGRTTAPNKSKAMTLDADEFMRRFLAHVFPKGFRRVASFGFLADSC